MIRAIHSRKSQKPRPPKTEGTQSPRKVDVRATRPVIVLFEGEDGVDRNYSVEKGSGAVSMIHGKTPTRNNGVWAPDCAFG